MPSASQVQDAAEQQSSTGSIPVLAGISSSMLDQEAAAALVSAGLEGVTLHCRALSSAAVGFSGQSKDAVEDQVLQKG